MKLQVLKTCVASYKMNPEDSEFQEITVTMFGFYGLNLN